MTSTWVHLSITIKEVWDKSSYWANSDWCHKGAPCSFTQWPGWSSVFSWKWHDAEAKALISHQWKESLQMREKKKYRYLTLWLYRPLSNSIILWSGPLMTFLCPFQTFDGHPSSLGRAWENCTFELEILANVAGLGLLRTVAPCTQIASMLWMWVQCMMWYWDFNLTTSIKSLKWINHRGLLLSKIV